MRTLACLAPLTVLCVAALAAPPAGPRKVRPTPLPVNTRADEDDPHVLDNRLYFASNAGGKFRIFTSHRQSPVAQWLPAQPVEGVAAEGDLRSPFLFAQRDGFQYLFFARRDKDAPNYDVYVAQRTDPRKEFSAVTPVHAVDTEADELHPWLTTDGKQMYFSRKKAGHWRVVVAERPTGIGPQFDPGPKEVAELPDDFHHATLSHDGTTMYLQGPVGNGRWGLFRSKKSGGKWGVPEELTMLNDPDGPTGDHSPCLSRDPASGVLYFASDRPGGKGGLDLYSVSVSLLRK